MKRSYGLEMNGPFVAEKVSSVPSWTIDDEGRILYDDVANRLYYGNNQGWVLLEDHPTGAIKMIASDSIPYGYLACDGSAISRSAYARLFSVIGTTWGIGDGSVTFNLPNLMNKFPLGVGGAHTIGQSGGSDTKDFTHTHTIVSQVGHNHGVSTIPNHTHTVSGDTGDNTSAPDTGSENHNDSGTRTHHHPVNLTSGAGGSHSHGALTGNNGSHSHGGATGSGGSASQDIKPVYATLKFVIKY